MSSGMVETIVNGLIGIAGGLITMIATKYYEQRQLLPVGNSRKKAVCGNWKGQVMQPPFDAYEIEISLTVKGHKVIGKGWLRVREMNIVINLDLEGGFLYENFLKIDYKNSDSATLQFGSMTFKLSPTPRQMKGKFSGYGSETDSVVGGEISLEKIPN